MSQNKDLPEFYLEHIEKGCRHDLRFRHLITEDAETTIWNLLVMLEKNGLHSSYLGEMQYNLPKDEK